MIGELLQTKNFWGVNGWSSSSDLHAPPALNTFGVTTVFSNENYRRKKLLYEWFKALPEFSGIAKLLVNDIMTGVSFKPLVDGVNSRNKLLRAKAFAEENLFNQLLREQVLECVAVGEGFSWVGLPKDKEVKAAVDSAVMKITGFKEVGVSDRVFLKILEDKARMIDDGLYGPRKLRLIPSTTVEVVYDSEDLKMYRQTVGTVVREYSPEEVIHLRFSFKNGTLNGLASFDSCFTQFDLLKLMWDNQRALQHNSGIMDKIISVKGVNVNSSDYTRMKEQLKSFQNVNNKHGTLLLTGDVNVTDVNSMDAMAYKEVGLYITGLLALQWSIPVSRIPFMVGNAMSKSDVGGVSDRGYNNNIEAAQLAIEELYNRELWNPYFGVRMEFDRSYKHNDVVENQSTSLRLSNVRTVIDLLARKGKAVKEEVLLRMLELCDDDVEKLKPEEKNNSGVLLADGEQMAKKPNKRQEEETVMKRGEQLNRTISHGKPTGVGK